MFRERDRQGQLFESGNLVPPEKRQRMDRTWAGVFRLLALPMIQEELFAPMYCEDNGRPNAPVQIVLGVLILKELFDLTDQEALDQLEYNLLWHYALRLTPEEAHLCQKTLHNFRARMMAYEAGPGVFRDVTGQILEALGTKTGRQRLDSTHISSNISRLTRLGLFCETNRLFLHAVRRKHPILYRRAPEGVRARYLKDDGEATAYQDARSSDSRRRLAVCARDLYRLIDVFRGTAAAKLEEYGLLERLFHDQCEAVKLHSKPRKDDDDAGAGGVPVRLKEAKEVASDSLQTPHDPDVTYSGHKGKGYEVQVCETSAADNEAEIITHVEVTPSSGSDATATIPTIEALDQEGIQPEELLADTTYGSAKNAVEAERLGTELVAPVPGNERSEDEVAGGDGAALTAADFDIDAGYSRPSVCPAGHKSIAETTNARGQENHVAIHFDRATCDACPQHERCPARLSADGTDFVLTVNLEKRNREKRRRADAGGEFRARYAARAGIEATNSELKRAHGLGRLRHRGREPVRLAVFLKALACNIKRMVRAILARRRPEAPMLA